MHAYPRLSSTGVGVLAWVQDGSVIIGCGGVHDLLRSTHDKAQAATEGRGSFHWR